MARKRRNDEVIGFIDPRPARRIAAVGGIGLLGLLLLYIAATTPPVDLGWLLFLIATGIGSVFLSWRMWQATGIRLELTPTELREAGGRTLCTLDEIASVDRGLFAFKPAGGFLIRLKDRTTRGRVYAPGLWWRARRRVMVGGVTSAAMAKSVADLMIVLIEERDAG